MDFRRVRLIGASWIVFLTMGCGGGESAAAVPDGPAHTLTVSATGVGAVASTPMGIACGTRCKSTFSSGTAVRLVAAAGNGYEFDGWGGACSGVDSCVVTMSAAHTVTAKFTAKRMSLSVTKSGSGTVTSSPAGINCGTSCSAEYNKYTNVTLTAAAAAGYTFTGWTGACSGATACIVQVNAAQTVGATFRPTNAGTKHTLTLNRIGSGTVTSSPSGINCGSTCTASYNQGTLVTMTATPAEGYEFSSWSGACTGAGAGTGKCSVTMDGARTVNATFTATSDLGTDGACKNFYTEGFRLVSGEVTLPLTKTAKPARGTAMRDAQYNTCRVRVTNHAVDGLATFARNDYSRRQAFNADSTYQIVNAIDGFWYLYDARTYQRIKVLPGLAGDAEAQWHHTDPNLMYYLPSNGMGMKVYQLNVQTGVSTTVGDLASRLKARWPTANAAWTKSEGSPSADGRYWCFMVDSATWTGLGLVTWDRQTDTILGYKDLNGQRPDHVSMSPSGNYCVSSSYGGPGVVSYSRDLSSSRKIANIGEHSDIGIDANGDDAYVSVDYQSANGDVFMTNLRTGVRTTIMGSYRNGTSSALHFSAKSFRKPGWFVMSAYGEMTNAPPFVQQWFHRKVVLVQMAASPKIYNLGTTHAEPMGYWTEPQASVNRDLTKIVWTSNWDISSDLDTDVYVIQIPASAVN